MTYSGFLLVFLVPLAVLLPAAYWIRGAGPRRMLWLPLAVSAIALLYTTPWDNYLVANRIWWYDPDRISGILFGWVPLEEYLFFLLQPIVTGSWTLWMLRRLPATSAPDPAGQPGRGAVRPALSAAFLSSSLRLWALLAVGLLWAGSVGALLGSDQSLRYLALILVWALPPLALQLAYGAPTLWRLRRPALLAVVPPTLYLAAADSVAIAEGIWTINPQRSTGWLLPGALPMEEFVFFLLTNVLIAFSVLLVRATPRRSAQPAIPASEG